MTSSISKRINLLTEEEIDELYRLPVFSQTEREEYFSLDDNLLNDVRSLLKNETKIYMVLLIGYFRAKPVIPRFQLCDVEEDARYICETLNLDSPSWEWSVSKGARAKMVSRMLSILGFSPLKKEQIRHLSLRLSDVATISTDPKYILDECLAFLGQNRIALPRYSTLQDLVTTTLTAERSRTTAILSEKMSSITQEKILYILNEKGVLSNLSGFKGSARDFSPTELKKELSTIQLLRTVYPEVKQLLSELKLSRGNMIYYASLVRTGSSFQLRRSPKWQGLLYLSCYIFYCFRESNDRLISSFSYLVRKHHESRVEHARSRVTKELEVIQSTLKTAGSILRYFTDSDISDDTAFGEVRKAAFSEMTQEDISLVSTHLVDGSFNRAEYQWEYTDSQSRKTAATLRKLFLALDLECKADQPALSAQIANAKRELLANRKLISVDLRLVKHNDLKHLVTDGESNHIRFEYYLYRKITGMIESGKVYINESEHNKRLEDDLIPVDIWEKKKSSLIAKTGLERLSAPIECTLAELESNFSEKLKKVISTINEDANDFVRVQPRSSRLTWSLANKRWKTPLDNPVYSQVKHMGIIEIMNYVNRKTGYLEAFDSLSSRKRNTKAGNHDLIACIFGNGANYGLHRLASSSDWSIGILRTVNDSYIRPETTGAANDIISNSLSRLPIFRHYTINESSPFSSIDGQKHACRINTFKARYSAKYFRKGKGVSAMTLVSNHVPLNTTVISANEYEGHYAFDLLYNNSSDIKPKSLATDNHGTNNVNFAVLDIFGYQFSPRYSKFKYAFEKLFEVNIDVDLDIKLKKPIRINLIKGEWDQIQHIICSLSRKSTEQQVIIRKLSNSKRGSRTLLALREYDRLIKCLYMLDYIDRKDLRQFVQQALNRGEAYHQLRRAIGNLNGDQLRGGSDYQIEQWNDCARLIANSIIYYNSALLSVLIERFEKQGNDSAIDLLSNISPVAWEHIQLTGHYVFNERDNMNLESMLESVQPLPSDT